MTEQLLVTNMRQGAESDALTLGYASGGSVPLGCGDHQRWKYIALESFSGRRWY